MPAQNNGRNTRNAVAALTLLLIGVSLLGFKVSPAIFTAQGLVPGERKPLGIKLTCYNDGDKPQCYVVSFNKPSIGKRERIAGYEPIPDPSWVSLDGGETLNVPAKSTVGQEIVVELPPDSALFNRHFYVAATVTPIGGGGMFITVLSPIYLLETYPIRDPSVPPGSKIGAAPNIVEFKDISAGDKAVQNFTIYNNDTTAYELKLSIELPDTAYQGLKTDHTYGKRWLKHSEWLSLSEKRIRLKGGRRKRISVELFVPKDAELIYPRETILYIRGENVPTAFIRIWVEP